MSQPAAADMPEQYIEETASGRRSYRFLIAGLVALLAVGYLIYNAMDANAAYYLKVNQLLDRGSQAYGERVRVAGKVVPGSVQREGSVLRFEAGDGSGRLPVVYEGVVPDIFGPNIDVVVEGRYTPQHVFEADTLLAKCPSKFESKPGTTTSMETSAVDTKG